MTRKRQIRQARRHRREERNSLLNPKWADGPGPYRKFINEMTVPFAAYAETEKEPGDRVLELGRIVRAQSEGDHNA